ncbi:MAG: hypothetical protein O7E52_22595 [Candidatus Poribacteria bacterium]|nr:hypothetical protein [Candidatus Poribacteria bacterium]
MICWVCLLLLPGSKISAEEGNSKKGGKKIVDKVKALLDGFTLGPEAQILPYASLDDWFDPYVGLKFQHRGFVKSVDKVNHHLKFENENDYSWKFRYAANSLATDYAKFSFLFKLKLDNDAFFYGIGNSTRKSDRLPATYSSVFVGHEWRQDINDAVVLRWSPGFWKFQSGLVEGGEFEAASDAQYFSSRVSLSDKNSLDFWKPAMDHQWSTYVEMGFPVNTSASFYSRFNVQSMAQFPFFGNAKIRVGNRFEFLVSPQRGLVPYFAMPEIGSRNGLRGFSKERFRNFALTSLNVEFSFPLTRNFGSFFRVDFARTASKPIKLLSAGIHKDIAFGVRLHNTSHPLSLGFAAGDDGTKFFSSIAVGSPW